MSRRHGKVLLLNDVGVENKSKNKNVFDTANDSLFANVWKVSSGGPKLINDRGARHHVLSAIMASNRAANQRELEGLCAVIG